MSDKEDRAELLDDYFQLGDPTDSYIPGDNKQKVDLTEFYSETGQAKSTVMVMGTEELSLGKLSKRTAALCGLKNVGSYDPFPSERNARMGAEGLITTIVEGFKSFIETIIKYIRMAIDWVVDTIKAIFGFRKSARITKAIDDELGNMKNEFETTLKALGFPVAEYSVEKYIGELPHGKDRKVQLNLLKSKLEGDKESIEGLAASLPLLQQCAVKIKQAGEKATQKQKNLKKVIGDEFSRTRVRHATGNQVGVAQSTEANRVAAACQEVKLALDVNEISGTVAKLYEALYKVKFSNEELTNGFNEVRTKLQATVKNETVKLSPQNTTEIMMTIQYLNARYQEINDNEIDLSKVNWKAIGQVVDAGDAEKVKAIANFYGYPPLLANYQEMSVALRNYTQFCFNVTQALMVVQKQIQNLIEWHHRCHAYYYAGVMGDIEGVIKAVKDAQAKGHPFPADAHGVPQIPCVYIREADAKTLAEKASANIKFIIENDIGNTKTIINNFSKQIGFGGLI